MSEARLDDSGSGLAPASDGWFTVGIRADGLAGVGGLTKDVIFIKK